MNNPHSSILRLTREYLRVSKDKSGRERSITEQHDDNARAAESFGFDLGEAYRDTGSASRYAKRAREGFDRLIDDLKDGTFGAEVLMLWESSRGSRRTGEWVLLVDLCQEQGVKIHVTTHGRTYDPANGRDRRMLLEDAVDSEYESYKTSLRVARSVDALARAGGANGPIPYGYKRIWVEQEGRFKRVVDESRAWVPRRLFALLVRGWSLRGIEKNFAARGYVNRSGKPFRATHLRTLALKPCYAGLRPYTPEGGETQHVEAQWPAIVSRESYWTVQRILNDPSRKTFRHGHATHVYPSVMRCGACGARTAAATARRRGANKHTRPPIIKCVEDCTTILKEPVDELLDKTLIDYLSSDRVYKDFAAQDGDNAELERVLGELAEVKRAHEELADQVARREITALLAARAEPPLLADIERLEQREQDLSTPSQLHRLITPGAGVAKQWAAMPTSAKREVARLVFAPGIVGVPHLMRKPRPGGRIAPARDRIKMRHEVENWPGGRWPNVDKAA